MKKLLALLAIAFVCAVQAQTVILTPQPVFPPPPTATRGQQIKCGKYQHIYHQDAYTGGACDGEVSATTCVTIAVYHPEINECVDDMHQITERDWQELMQRIKVVEEKQQR